MYKFITVIVTCYNAQKTIKKALTSIQQTKRRDEIEVIVVDDCSSDNSAELINQLKDQYDNIKLIVLDKNTGTPSTPRNIGMKNATGKFIAFLDDDDYMDSDNLMEMADYADKNNLDFLHGYIKVVKNGEISIANRIEYPDKERIAYEIIKNQSTTLDFIIRKDFRDKFDIKFDTKYKISEDTLFYSDCFKNNARADYIDSFFTYYLKDSDVFNPSSTQNCSDFEINNMINVWKEIRNNLKQANIDYFEIRLGTAVSHLLISIVNFSKGNISRDTFIKLSILVKENDKYLSKSLNLPPRFQEVYDSIIKVDYEEFNQVTKLRLLIAGYDLKFIKPLIPHLSADFNISVDEWKGHDINNSRISEKLLNRTDIIWCEWLLGNAVWYSKRKMSHQNLIIRAHRFEIGLNFGYEVDYSKVDAVICIAYYYLEKFIKQFNIPRHKANLISNYIEIYDQNGKKNKNESKISMVGILPKRKGFMRGLKLLNRLNSDKRDFELYISGQKPEEVDWIWSNPEEQNYFKECYKYIKDNNLEDKVIFTGFIKREDLYKDIGYTLSLSDNEHPESFHLSIAEGAAAGSLPLSLDWEGIEYIYPRDIICKNEEEIYEKIISTYNDPQEYENIVNLIGKFVIENYSSNIIVEKIVFLINKIRMNLF